MGPGLPHKPYQWPKMDRHFWLAALPALSYPVMAVALLAVIFWRG